VDWKTSKGKIKSMTRRFTEVSRRYTEEFTPTPFSSVNPRVTSVNLVCLH